MEGYFYRINTYKLVNMLLYIKMLCDNLWGEYEEIR